MPFVDAIEELRATMNRDPRSVADAANRLAVDSDVYAQTAAILATRTSSFSDAWPLLMTLA